jgi:hypothetical protein
MGEPGLDEGKAGGVFVGEDTFFFGEEAVFFGFFFVFFVSILFALRFVFSSAFIVFVFRKIIESPGTEIRQK